MSFYLKVRLVPFYQMVRPTLQQHHPQNTPRCPSTSISTPILQCFPTHHLINPSHPNQANPSSAFRTSLRLWVAFPNSQTHQHLLWRVHRQRGWGRQVKLSASQGLKVVAGGNIGPAIFRAFGGLSPRKGGFFCPWSPQCRRFSGEQIRLTNNNSNNSPPFFAQAWAISTPAQPRSIFPFFLQPPGRGFSLLNPSSDKLLP